ncbi:MAG TPA: ABC transporter permease [Candidatus Binatia bacterium]|nr:ABC transporter permease [Candidatus Binatia bacterium]
MKTRTLIWNSLRFRARAHVGVVLGAIVGSAALIGALIVGDSVRETLRQRALERLGGAELVLDGRDRFFELSLQDRLSSAYKDLTKTNPSSPDLSRNPDPDLPSFHALLRLPAVASTQDGAARANQVQVWGVSNVPPNSVWLNNSLRAQLGVLPSDTIILRVHKPSALSRDAVITPRDDTSIAFRLTVEGFRGRKFISAKDNGNLNPASSQLPPLNAFVNLNQLAQAAGVGSRANVLLAGGIPDRSKEFVYCLLRASFLPEDAELTVSNVPNAIQLSTRRIFLDDAAVQAARTTNSIGVLTYLANLIRAGDRTTPYSMITAAGPPYTPADMKDNEIIVNEWLADDLALKPGGSIDVSYYIPDAGSQLKQATNTFIVSKIVPISGVHDDRTLMPEFPGLAKAESTHDWDAGFPLEYKIRDKDEAYWKQHRGTPKAFITAKAGQQLWANRFGSLTAIRWPAAVPRDEVYNHLRANLDPTAIGLAFDPARDRALAAANNAQDFGGLFLGFSLFLIAASLILMALLFQFGLEQRTEETGILLALGFTPKRVRRLFLAEGSLLAVIAAVLGVIGGIVYARLMLLGLATLWRDAVGSEPLGFHVTAQSIIIGLIGSAAVCAITIAIVLRKQARKPARELLASGAELESQGVPGRVSRMALIIGVFCVLGAIALVLSHRSGASPETFFGAGSLLLISGVAFAAVALQALNRMHRLSIVGLGIRSATRRRKRSLATIALLASGAFMIIAVNANRLEADPHSPGTGGFELIGQSALPILQHLNSAKGLESFGLTPAELKGVAFVQMRVREGDEASCLNLNRAQQPRLLGVNPDALQQRKAFGVDWSLLKQNSDAVPAIGDEASIKWAMGKKIGDTLDYMDEQGRAFKIRIVAAAANSILQGQLLIDEAQFVKKFPAVSGYRMFLIDTPSNSVSQVAATLGRALQDAGMELVPAARRLAQFNAVQNTYLSTFQVLGGIGLLLGSLGLGIVVLRNVLERRGELGLLQAVGYRKRSLQWLVASENLALLATGLLIGGLAAAVTVLPLARRVDLPYLTLVGVIVFGAASAWTATWFAMRGRLIDSLRAE